MNSTAQPRGLPLKDETVTLVLGASAFPRVTLFMKHLLSSQSCLAGMPVRHK